MIELLFARQPALLEEKKEDTNSKSIVASDAKSEVRILKARKVQVGFARDWNQRLIVAIKVDLEKGKPFPQLNSNLITLTIFQFLEKAEAIDVL